jgi:hypothetical protein
MAPGHARTSWCSTSWCAAQVRTLRGDVCGRALGAADRRRWSEGVGALAELQARRWRICYNQGHYMRRFRIGSLHCSSSPHSPRSAARCGPERGGGGALFAAGPAPWAPLTAHASPPGHVGPRLGAGGPAGGGGGPARPARQARPLRGLRRASPAWRAARLAASPPRSFRSACYNSA